MEYTTKGTCSRKILFEVEDGKVHNVQFVGGCNGNTQGVARLVEGMDVNEAISRMTQRTIMVRDGRVQSSSVNDAPVRAEDLSW